VSISSQLPKNTARAGSVFQRCTLLNLGINYNFLQNVQPKRSTPSAVVQGPISDRV